MPVLKTGDTFAKYRILSYLGGGAYGEVYRVTETGGDDTLTIEFALKLPKDSTIARDVLMKEARVWSACSQHPNIARLVKAGFEGEQFYMLSEYISGGSLRGKIGLNKGRPEVTQLWAVELVCGILRAVIHLHTPRKISGYDSDQQVLHRDLKPENILLDGDVPKITDFGVSRAFRSSEGVMSSGGTLYYNSPESFQGGMTSGNDVWSCAVILYELLSGHLPFEGEHQAQVMHSIMLSPLPMLPSCVPLELGRIVLRALEKSPEKRYASANEFLHELEEIRNHLGSDLSRQPHCKHKSGTCCLMTVSVSESEPAKTIVKPREERSPAPPPVAPVQPAMKTPVLAKQKPHQEEPRKPQATRVVLGIGSLVLTVVIVFSFLLRGTPAPDTQPKPDGKGATPPGNEAPTKEDKTKLTNDLKALLNQKTFDVGKAESLVQRGADPNVRRNPDGVTPLILAAKLKQQGAVKTFLQAKAEVDAQDNDGGTALMEASYNGSEAIVRLLLDSGATVEKRTTREKATALMYASMHERNLSVAKLLMSHGANPNAKDSNGNTPRTLARTDAMKQALTIP